MVLVIRHSEDFGFLITTRPVSQRAAKFAMLGNSAYGGMFLARRTHVNVVHPDGLQDLCLDRVSDANLRHDGDRDGLHDLFDHPRIRLYSLSCYQQDTPPRRPGKTDHACDSAIAANVRRDPLYEALYQRDVNRVSARLDVPKAMTALAPASSAIFACSTFITSMITLSHPSTFCTISQRQDVEAHPPLSICANPVLTPKVPPAPPAPAPCPVAPRWIMTGVDVPLTLPLPLAVVGA